MVMSPHSVASIEEMADIFRQSTVHVTGATIITHGYQQSDNDGDSLMPLALAIRDRADRDNGSSQTSWLLDYDIGHEGVDSSVDGEPAVFDLTESGGATGLLPTLNMTSGQSGQLVLLFDWATESNESSAGWTEAAGDALFSLIVELGLVDPVRGTSVPLHFIGHSFGSAVTSEAIERLAAYNVRVDQVTYLDPHDFDELHSD